MDKQVAKQEILAQLEQIKTKIDKQAARQRHTINENTIEMARMAGNARLIKMLQ